VIKIEVDDSKAIARLEKIPDAVRAALLQRVSALTVQLAARVRAKLSGEVLHVRSGALRASIFEDVQNTSTSVTGSVYSSGDVPYAAIHEYGGVIPAHEVVPVKAHALRFEIGGKTVFAMRANIPAIHMPERSYMRSSLAEMKEQIISELQEAIVGAMQ
jgi:phage gpG-like protein